MMFSHVGGSRHPLDPVLRILGIVKARFEDLGGCCDFDGAPVAKKDSLFQLTCSHCHTCVGLCFFMFFGICFNWMFCDFECPEIPFSPLF